MYENAREFILQDKNNPPIFYKILEEKWKSEFGEVYLVEK